MAEHDEHVIEVRAGVAEPASMHFRQGREVGPLSLGRSGSWRVSALGVLDLHGYVYFNGVEMFLQSTDGATPVLYKGAPIAPGRWTSVRAPGEIAIGSAVLWFGEASAAPEANVPAARPSAPQRPFAPGAFSIQDEDSDATRLQPIEEMAAARLARPRPAAGAPALGGGPLGGGPPLEARPPIASAGTMVMPQIDPMSPLGVPIPGGPPGMPFMGPPGGPVAPSMQGMPPGAMGPGGAPGAPPPMGSNPGGGYGPGGVPMGTAPEMVYAPGGAGAPGPAAGGKPSALEQAKTQWANATPIQKIILVLMPFVMVGSWFAFGEEEELPPPPRKPAASASASSPTPAGSGSAPAMAGSADPTAALPTAELVTPTADAADAAAPSNRPVAPTLPTLPPGTPAKRSLERDAVDAVAAGNFEQAAKLYDELAKEHPDEPKYAEAARILHAKAGGK